MCKSIRKTYVRLKIVHSSHLKREMNLMDKHTEDEFSLQKGVKGSLEFKSHCPFRVV